MRAPSPPFPPHAVPPVAMDGRWAATLLRFNLEPATYAHASWLPAWAPQASARVRQQLSRELLSEHGLDTRCDWTLAEPASRLFLLDTAARQRVALALGVAAHRDTLRQVVRKDDLAQLRAGVGEPLETLWLSIAEQVPRATGDALSWRMPFDVAALLQQLTLAGEWVLLGQVDAGGPPSAATAARARFCLPRGAPTTGLTSPGDRLTDTILTDLLPRWAPAWTWLF